MQLTRTLYVLCAGVCHDTGSWPFVLWTLLSCVGPTHQWMCTSSQAFPFFLLPSWVCLYWFTCVQRRRCSGSTTYKVQPRRHDGVRQTWRALQLIARLCETCMHRTSTLSLASALHLPDRTRETVLEFPSTRNRFPSTVLVMPKDCFSKIPLSRWATHLPVTCWYTSALFEGAPNKFCQISP